MSFSFCFFKQNTSYEMRSSDWSSDVCSSDLEASGSNGERESSTGFTFYMDSVLRALPPPPARRVFLPFGTAPQEGSRLRAEGWEIGRAACRERVCQSV